MLEPQFVLWVLAVLILSAAFTMSLARRLRAPRWAVFGLLVSGGLVFVALLIAGRGNGWIDLTRLDITLVSGCFDGAIEWSGGMVSYLNMVLFAPLAFFAALIVRRPVVSGVSVCLLAVFMELLQNALDLGVCSEADIAQNLIGAVLGTIVGAVAMPFLAVQGKSKVRSDIS